MLIISIVWYLFTSKVYAWARNPDMTAMVLISGTIIIVIIIVIIIIMNQIHCAVQSTTSRFFLCKKWNFVSWKYTKSTPFAQIYTKSFVGWGFASDPTGGAHSAPQTP